MPSLNIVKISRTFDDSSSAPAACCSGAAGRCRPESYSRLIEILTLTLLLLKQPSPGLQLLGWRHGDMSPMQGYKVAAMVIRNVTCERSSIAWDQGKEAEPSLTVSVEVIEDRHAGLLLPALLHLLPVVGLPLPSSEMAQGTHTDHGGAREIFI